MSALPAGNPGVDLSFGSRRIWRVVGNTGVVAAALLILGVLVWQGVTAHGNPDPTVTTLSPWAAMVDTGVLVFREGLEAILVLTALTASLVRTDGKHWKPVGVGASLGFVATIVTWFIVVAILGLISSNNVMKAQSLQAATGLLAILVLIVVMNWFFHKVYWTGWIVAQNRLKRQLLEGSRSRRVVLSGLTLIGFTSVYREGFEVVLFLQDLRLKAGGQIVLAGTLIGLALTAVVAMLTFVAHYKLPYKRMLVLTGVMLGMVLVVMVGENVAECQQALWFGNHPLSVLFGDHPIFTNDFPDWMNTWFGVFNSVEGLGAQAATAAIVIGSYFAARRIKRSAATAEEQLPVAQVSPA